MLWCEHVFVPGRLFYLYTGNFILSVLIHTYIHTYIHNLYLNTKMFKAIKACGIVSLRIN